MKAPFAVGETITPSKPMPNPNHKASYVAMGEIRIIDRVTIAGDGYCKFCHKDIGGIFIIGWRGEYCQCQWRKLNPDDYEALRQKHGIPTPATVKTE